MGPGHAPRHTAVMDSGTAPEKAPEKTLDVFLVENSPLIRERLLTLLAPIAGIRVVGFAERSDEAIREILRQRPEAVILDLNLAGGSGIDVLRAVSAEAPEVEVFVLTNYANSQYRRLCTGLGARGFFDKSTEFEKVRDAIAARATH